MAIENWSNDLMTQIDREAWRVLSEKLSWDEELLEKYWAKVDWAEISNNMNIAWTGSILEKFQDSLDWEALSGTLGESLTADLIERFEERWNWSTLSGNNLIKLDYELIDRFINRWDWEALFSRYDSGLFDQTFLERYKEYIPRTALQRLDLWHHAVEQRMWEIAREMIPESGGEFATEEVGCKLHPRRCPNAGIGKRE